MHPKALILLATGTNRDHDVAQALELAGAEAVIVPLQQLRASRQSWKGFQLLVVPGGFSYADALGAGKLLALDLIHYFASEVTEFVADGKPVLGICNGFQALVKAGILPFTIANGEPPDATLTFNAGGRFECRWVNLQPVSQACIWTQDLHDPIECPVAHGEGNFIVRDSSIIERLKEGDQIALTYVDSNGISANGVYPYNPNGSIQDIAGVCNPAGNVLGLMPHPEDHVFPYQSPHWMRSSGGSGLPLFQNGVRYAHTR